MRRPPSSSRTGPLRWSDLDALVARRAAQAERATDAEVDRIVALPNPMDRMAAHAALVRLLDEEGATLSPAATSRILHELHKDAEAREREARRAKYLAEEAQRRRLYRLRPWALCVGVPLAAGLPVAAAIGLSGWPLLGVLAAAVEAPWMPLAPTLGVVAALCGVGFCAWFTARAESIASLEVALFGAFAAGFSALVAAWFLPVYLASAAARMADGGSIGGSIVRVEHLSAQSDRLHVLLGNERLKRGMVLHLEGGNARRYLGGGS